MTGCSRSFHALFFIYKLTYFVLFSPSIALNPPTTPLSFIAYCPFVVILITTEDNSLSGTIPPEIGQLTELYNCQLREYRVFPHPPSPLYYASMVFSYALPS
jgi:hypothetical protein